MEKRDFISIRDADAPMLEALLDIAEEMRADIKASPRKADRLWGGGIMASLFLEPSTRTRMSFDAAMLRLGGGIIAMADAEAFAAGDPYGKADLFSTVRLEQWNRVIG